MDEQQSPLHLLGKARRNRLDGYRPTHRPHRFATHPARGSQCLSTRGASQRTDVREGIHHPLRRAMRTCELAGFGPVGEIDADLLEWDYGDYEGRLTVDILKERPDWQLFRDGCPGGESPQQVATRADRVVSRVRAIAGDVLLFSSGHFLRMVATRWIGIEPINGQSLMLSTASLSAVGYENSILRPAIRLWNDTHHVLTSSEQNAARFHARATS